MPTTISIVMGTYKGARFIEEQLASLAAQTVLPTELIVTDDCSPDETFEIVEAFARRSPFPVKASVNRERLGYAGNFLQATSRSRGDLIAFCDQDDIWYANKLEVMRQHFSRPDVLLAEHGYDLIDEAGRVTTPAPQLTPRSTPALGIPTTWYDGPGFAMMFRRSLLSFQDGWFDSVLKSDRNSRAAHDHWIGWLAKSLGHTVFDPTPLAGYRQHDANVFGARPPDPDRRKCLANHGFALARFADCMMRSRAYGRWGDAAPRAVQANRLYAEELMLQSKGDFKSIAALFMKGAYLRPRWTLGKRAFLVDLRSALLSV